ncbi:metal ABC transporter solute-binding protein, Zn/Mn family [Pontibacter sp. G13]|uniref:metal ABC transporter solute-binding protein, Zn/Mn family n=1 Tax=Pontibacter sp. G13 TaxID=3074898 RepID=UPI00288920F0|nr:zinc ABC transporter substrate-binding protein [Pontibacter sp. G13]WNJ18852.1 zinc ABC transporter substrate-binding protein [Pontibacter sp. G13]
MKPLTQWILSWIFLWICSVQFLAAQTADRPMVLATTSFIADLAREVAGSEAHVVSLMPIGGDPHVYDPVPGDAKKIAEADLILKNGLTLEGWLDEMIDNSGTQAEVVTLTEGISPIKSADHENAYDPHCWMDVQYAMIYVQNICDALIRLDPDNRGTYQANAETYLAKLQALDTWIADTLSLIPANHRVIATSHDAFRYFGNRYGMRVVSILGTSTDAEPRIEDYLNMLNLIERDSIPAIFIESTINPKKLQQMAKDKGIKVGGKLFADSLGDEESGADTYLNMMRQNTRLLVAGLQNKIGLKREEDSLSFLWVMLAAFVASFLLVMFFVHPKGKDPKSWENYQLSIDNLNVSYGKKVALSNVHLNIQPGQVYGLIGGNGSGKSTMMKSILGLLEPDTGSILLNGQPIDEVRKYISYIPQKEEIDWTFPATVLDVVLMGRYPHRSLFTRLGDQDRAIAQEAIKKLGIWDLRNKQIGELSGGQQQRAFIARALAQQAEVYLFDEPFVGVDITSETKIMEIIRGLAEDGKMVIIIHHDLAKIQEYFDQLIMLNQHVVAAGPTASVFHDENLRKTYGGKLTILQEVEHYR